MRVQIALPPDVEQKVRDQARSEHRRLRQQVEFILWKAVRESETENREPVGVAHE